MPHRPFVRSGCYREETLPRFEAAELDLHPVERLAGVFLGAVSEDADHQITVPVAVPLDPPDLRGAGEVERPPTLANELFDYLLCQQPADLLADSPSDLLQAGLKRSFDTGGAVLLRAVDSRDDLLKIAGGRPGYCQDACDPFSISLAGQPCEELLIWIVLTVVARVFTCLLPVGSGWD